MFYRAEMFDQHQNKDYLNQLKRLQYRWHPIIWKRKVEKSWPILGEYNTKLFGN